MAPLPQTPNRPKRNRQSEELLAPEIRAIVASETDGRLFFAQSATEFLDRVLPVDQHQIENARQSLLDAELLLEATTHPGSKYYTEVRREHGQCTIDAQFVSLRVDVFLTPTI
jgi:hypothetical protein